MHIELNDSAGWAVFCISVALVLCFLTAAQVVLLAVRRDLVPAKEEEEISEEEAAKFVLERWPKWEVRPTSVGWLVQDTERDICHLTSQVEAEGVIKMRNGMVDVLIQLYKDHPNSFDETWII